MNVKLRGALLEVYTKKRNFWEAWIRLSLLDSDKKVEIPEDFYLYATNSIEMAKETEKKARADLKKTLILDGSLDLIKIAEYIRKNFEDLDFTDWNEFYSRMESKFEYEE